MKKALFLLLLTTPVFGTKNDHKVYVHVEYADRSDRVIFIQDLETGTRCYAITSDWRADSGYAISCVKE